MELFRVTPDIFTCCFLVNEMSDNGSTHLFSQAFMRFHNNKYDYLPIHIPNLSESNNLYKTPEPSSSTFINLLKELKIDKQTNQGFIIITKIQKALQNHIDKVVEDLSILEKYMYEIEENIKLLELRKVKKKIDGGKDEFSISFNDSQEDILLRKVDNDLRYSFDSENSSDKTISKVGTQKITGRGKIVKDRKEGRKK